MKYCINKKKLPFSEDHHDFTLTICLGSVKGEVESYEAKVQLPAESYRDGLALYRQFIQEQRAYIAADESNCSLQYSKLKKQKERRALAQ